MYPFLECARTYIATVNKIIQSSGYAYLLFLPFAADCFCFVAYAADFHFCLAFCGTDYFKRSRTVPMYFQELIQAVTTTPTVISSASARMCFMFTWFCSPLYDLSIQLTKTLFFSKVCSTPPTNSRSKRLHTFEYCIN